MYTYIHMFEEHKKKNLKKSLWWANSKDWHQQDGRVEKLPDHFYEENVHGTYKAGTPWYITIL